MHKQNWANGDTNGRSQQTRPTLAAHNRERKTEQSVTTAVNHMTFQNSIFFGQTADAGKKTINKMTTKQGQDKSQLY